MRAIGIVIAGSLALSGCNPTADNDSSAVTLAVVGFEAPEGEGRSGIVSDVVSDSGVPADDTLYVLMASIPKGQGEVSDFYRIIINSVQVVFTRIDGRNIPGVDVPFPQVFAIAGDVAPGTEREAMEIFLVTPQMKSEPPLRNLWFGSGQRLVTTATITVFGHDLVGNEVSASGSIVVAFEDFPG